HPHRESRPLRLRAEPSARGPPPGPNRRHGRLQGDQLLPEPDRVAHPPAPGHEPRVPDPPRARPGRRPPGGARRGAPGVPDGRGRAPPAGYPGAARPHRGGPRGEGGRDPASPGQGGARRRPPGGAAVTALDALFAPRRLALLGVSRDPAKLGHVLLRNVITAGFPGEMRVVNPTSATILEMRTACW